MTRLLVFAALVISIYATSVSGQDADQSKKKTAVFKGRVTRSDTKQQVARVEIMLMDSKKSDSKDNSVRTETDKDGNFLLGDVQPGKYTISIRAIFDREEDVPCQFLIGKIDESNSKVVVLADKDKHIEQIFIDGFSVKAGKEIKKDFDLVCKSFF